MPNIQHANRAISTLDGAIADSAVTIDVQGGEGARFPSLTGSQYFYAMLIDLTKVSSTYAHWEIVKVTARTTDQLTVTRDIDGTNLGFPDGSPIHLIWCSEGIDDSITHPSYLEPDVISQATAPALTNTSASVLLIAPVANQTVTLPTSNVLAGRFFFIANTGSSSKTVQVNASGGGAIVILEDGESFFLIATQNAPTAAAHWAEIHNVFINTTLTTPTITNPTITGGGSWVGSPELEDLIVRNYKSVNQATAPTLTYQSEEYVVLTPTEAIAQALPTTSVKKGRIFKIINLASTAGYNITINADDASLVWLVCPGNECTVMALQDTPTSNAHWRVVERGWALEAQVTNDGAAQTNITEISTIKVVLDTTIFDPAAIFNNANDRLVLPILGRWRVSSQVALKAAANTNDKLLALNHKLELNGAVVWQNESFTVGGTNGILPLAISSHVSFIVNVTTPGTDYVEAFIAYTDDSGVNAGDIPQSRASLSAVYIGT